MFLNVSLSTQLEQIFVQVWIPLSSCSFCKTDHRLLSILCHRIDNCCHHYIHIALLTQNQHQGPQKIKTVKFFNVFYQTLNYRTMTCCLAACLAFRRTWAAILSRSRLPWVVRMRPPSGTFSTSFRASRAWSALRAMLPDDLEQT